MPAARKILVPQAAEPHFCDGSIACDTFSGESNGTLLTAHTPDVGGPWVHYAGADHTIEADEAYTPWSGGSGVVPVAALEIGQTDAVVSANIRRLTFTVNSGGIGVCLRLQHATTFNMALLETLSDGDVRMAIWQVVNNAYTVLIRSDGFAFIEGAELLVEVSGTSYDAYYNGTLRAHAVTTASQVQTKFGLASQVMEGNWDDFKVQSL